MRGKKEYPQERITLKNTHKTTVMERKRQGNRGGKRGKGIGLNGKERTGIGGGSLLKEMALK